MVAQDERGKRIGDGGLLPQEELLASLHSLLQNVKIHQDNNVLVGRCVARFRQVVGMLLEEYDDITIQISKGTFFIGGERLVYRRGAALLVEHMMKFMERRGLVGIQFHSTVMTAPAGQIVAFARLLLAALGQKNPMAWLVLRLEEVKFFWVVLLQPEIVEAEERLGFDAGGAGDTVGSDLGSRASAAAGDAGETSKVIVEVAGRRSPRRLYAYALAAVKEVAEKIAANRRAGIKNAVRIVQNMVEEIALQEQPRLLAMSTIRIYDDYTYSHSVNVAILAMYFGKKIGADKETLECLGICGLFHDLGKVRIPAAILSKATPLSAAEVAAIHEHSLNSVRMILRLRASARRKAAIILPPLEHHMRFDQTGYPDIGWSRPQSTLWPDHRHLRLFRCPDLPPDLSGECLFPRSGPGDDAGNER